MLSVRQPTPSLVPFPMTGLDVLPASPLSSPSRPASSEPARVESGPLSFQAANEPQRPPAVSPSNIANDPTRPGLDRLDAELWRVLSHVPAGDRDLRHDVRGAALVAFLEAARAGKTEEEAVAEGIKAADRARRPKGNRSKTRTVSLSVPGVMREAEAAGESGQPGDAIDAARILEELPAQEREVARLAWVEGFSQEAIARDLKVRRSVVRKRLRKAAWLGRKIARRPPRKAKGPIIRKRNGGQP